MRKPNFFILGAPKCGTTSLANWLSEHPQVFFSPVKEPHFFNFDYGHRTFTSFKKYQKLFSAAEEQHIAIGEASVRYLYSRSAVPAIRAYTPKARFIVMVRNPVDMSYALHEQLVFNGEENEKDFERAWGSQSVRMYGDQIPAGVDPQQLLYGPLCQVGKQLIRLFEIVPHEKVLMVNLEHVQCNPQQEYRRVLSFLGLDDDERQTFPVVNKAKKRRLPGIQRATRWANRTLRAAGVPHVRLGITESLHSWDRIERTRPSMSETMRKRLCEYFSDDVDLLEDLTGWDLKHWRI